jgi:hypothetical protein
MSENQEVNNKTEDSFKVEVEDDTPPEDRNRAPLPPKIKEELEKDTLEEYSDKVKQRLSQMRKLAHDERREKEKFAREREEAVRLVQHYQSENNRLKQRVGVTEKVFAKETTEAANVKVQAAEDALKRAYEAGDPEKLVKAQKELNDAQLLLRERSNFRPTVQEQDFSVQQQPQTQDSQRANQPAYDQKAVAWRDKNTWFGADEEMTALALGVHEKLFRSGVDPTSDDYYRRIDETMRKRFPDYFGEETQTPESEPEKPARKVSTVVAPATRSTSSSRQVRITASEAAIAKRLGLTPEAYAREKLKLENTNG